MRRKLFCRPGGWLASTVIRIGGRSTCCRRARGSWAMMMLLLDVVLCSGLEEYGQNRKRIQGDVDVSEIARPVVLVRALNFQKCTR